MPAARIARALHRLFEATLLAKASLATLEAASGLGLWLTPNAAVHAVVGWLTRNQIAHEPNERVVGWFAQVAGGFSGESQHFYALYLLSHGLLKLAMVALLARRVLWAYPASVVLLTAFIAYQMHHWTETQAPALLLLSAFDGLMIALVLREYRGLRRLPHPA